ncbi:hypothetical protein MJO29_016822, partial [Puccinia striiformis f. sp. tritici]
MPDKKTVDADIEVVQPKKANTSKTQPNPGTGPEKSQRSWVWVHFKVHNDKHYKIYDRASSKDPRTRTTKKQKNQSASSPESNEASTHWLNLLKQAIAYLIAEADLLYAIVERKSLRWLLELLNPATVNMEFGRKAIATKVDLLYIAHKDHLQARLKGMNYLSFTLAAWTSPNSKAFMAITVHGITRDWKMLDMLVGMPAVH